MTSLCAPRARRENREAGRRRTKRRAVSWPSRFQQHLEAHDRRTAIREVSNALDAYVVAVMHEQHDLGQVLAEDGTQSAMLSCPCVCSLSTLLIRCTVCEVVGASPQTPLSVSR